MAHKLRHPLNGSSSLSGLRTRSLLVLFVLCLGFQSSFGSAFSDDHSDGLLQDWTVVGSRSWEELNGSALPADESGSPGFLIRNGAPLVDGDLLVNLKADQWSGHRGGVVFRYNSPSAYYYVGVRPANAYESHVYFCKGSTDNCSPLGVNNLSIGSAVELLIQMRGTRFTVKINGDSATTIDDASYASGQVGYAHSGEWNRLCSFEGISWTPWSTASSSSALSSSATSSSVVSSSSQTQSSSSTGLSSSQQSVAQVQVSQRLMGNDLNWYAVSVTVRNVGERAIENPRVGWHYVWSDHSDSAVVELDYSNFSGVAVNTEERDDFSATAWFQITGNLAVGDSAVLNLRLHTKDWGSINRINDPSVNGVLSVMEQEVHLAAPVPRQPFPTNAKQEAVVDARVVQHNQSTLGMVFTVRNTGVVPLRSVRFHWYADTLVSEQSVVGVVDYAQILGTSIRKDRVGSRVQFTVSLGEGYLAAGASTEVHVRLHSSAWGSVDFTDDWSWQGMNSIMGNGYMTVTSDGLLVAGKGPWVLDTDGDGVPDAVEISVGSDPLNALDAPLVGIPDRVQLVGQTEPEYVTYDFSQVPGFSDRDRMALEVKPGDFVNNEVPWIVYRGASVNRPEFRKRNFFMSGGFWEVHANPVVGKTIEMVVPLPSVHSRTMDATHTQVYRFDEAQSQWQALKVVGYDGAIHVSTKQFSVVQAGVEVEDRRIAAGDSHVVMIDTLVNEERSEWVYALGFNGQGRLGHGEQGFKESLMRVQGIENVRSVSAGARSSYALTWDGKVYAWGDNRQGQLGNSTVIDSTFSPVLVEFPDNVVIKQLDAGRFHVLAMDDQNRLWGWGRSIEGQLGLDELGDLRLENQNKPVLVHWPKVEETEIRFRATASGAYHVIAIDSAGTLWGWGKNTAQGELYGLGVGVFEPTPLNGENRFYPFGDAGALPLVSPIFMKSGANFSTAVRSGHDWGYQQIAWGSVGESVISSGPLATLVPWPRPMAMAAGESHVASLVKNVLSIHGNADGEFDEGHYAYMRHRCTPPEDNQPKPCYTAQYDYVIPWSEMPLTLDSLWVLGEFDSGVPVPVPDPSMNRLVGQYCVWGENELPEVCETGLWSVYEQIHLRQYDSQNGNSWVSMPGAKDVAAGNGFTALWYPELRILGNMAGHDYGVNGTEILVDRKMDYVVRIVSPVAESSILGGSEIDVQWILNGVTQPLAKFQLPLIPAQGRQFKVIHAYTKDLNDYADTVLVNGLWNVSIVSPASGQVVVPGFSQDVQWSVNGVLQTQFDTEEISASLNPGDSYTISRSLSLLNPDLTDAGSVDVIVGQKEVAGNLSMSGSLEYDGSTASVTKTVKISVPIYYDATLTIKATAFGESNVVCTRTVNVPAGTTEYDWDGFCDDGKWIAEGLHGLDISIKMSGESLVSSYNAEGVDLNSAPSGFYFNTFSADPVSLITNTYLNSFPYNTVSIFEPVINSKGIVFENAYIAVNKGSLWTYTNRCPSQSIRMGSQISFKIRTYQIPSRYISSIVIPSTDLPKVSNTRTKSLWDDVIHVNNSSGEWIATIDIDGNQHEFSTIDPLEWISRYHINSSAKVSFVWTNEVATSKRRCFNGN